MNNERCRNFALITYHSEEVIKAVLTLNSDLIRHYAYILHDKDIRTKENGEVVPVEPHYHLLLNLNNAMTYTAVCKLFPKEQNTMAQPMRDMSDCFNYLNHNDKPDKYQYDDSLIKCDDLDYWQGLKKGESADRVLNILDDILNGVSFRDLAKRYGRDLIINYYKYRQFAIEMQRQEDLQKSISDKGIFSRSSTFEDRQMFFDMETGEIN